MSMMVQACELHIGDVIAPDNKVVRSIKPSRAAIGKQGFLSIRIGKDTWDVPVDWYFTLKEQRQ